MPIGIMPELAILWPENMVMLSDRNRTLSDNTQINVLFLISGHIHILFTGSGSILKLLKKDANDPQSWCWGHF